MPHFDDLLTDLSRMPLEAIREKRAFTIRTIRTFPDWSHEQVGEFVAVSMELIR